MNYVTCFLLNCFISICTRISSEGFIKVADFGLSECIYEKRYFRQALDDDSKLKLPIKWMAPESVENAIFTEKTDVVWYMVFAKYIYVVFVISKLQFLGSGHLEWPVGRFSVEGSSPILESLPWAWLDFFTMAIGWTSLSTMPVQMKCKQLAHQHQ